MAKARLILTAGLLGAWGLGAQRLVPPGITTLPIGGGALAIGDINHDGRRDIVTARTDGATVFLGDGRGRFVQAQGSPFAAGSSPSDLALGDFDADGRLDVAVANHETSTRRCCWATARAGWRLPFKPPYQAARIRAAWPRATSTETVVASLLFPIRTAGHAVSVAQDHLAPLADLVSIAAHKTARR